MPVTNVRSFWESGSLVFRDLVGTAIARFDGTAAGLGTKRIVNLAAGSQALTADQTGQKFVAAVDAVFSLPATTPAMQGVTYEFECGAVSAGTGFAISPAATDNIRGNGYTAVDNKDLINSGATDRLGDMVRIYCDGADWVIDAIVGTFAKEP